MANCPACTYPTDEHSTEDAATCADVAREMAAEDAAERAREEGNASLWRLGRSVGK